MAKSYFYVRDAGTVREGSNANFTIQRTGDLSRYEKSGITQRLDQQAVIATIATNLEQHIFLLVNQNRA